MKVRFYPGGQKFMKEFKSSREIIHHPDEADVLEIIDKRRKKLIEEYPPTQEMENFLNSIDFPVAQSIFTKIAQRCGISKESLNFVDKSSIIEATDGYGATGLYYTLENIIALSKITDPDLYNLSLTPKESMVKNINRVHEVYGEENIRLLHSLF